MDARRERVVSGHWLNRGLHLLPVFARVSPGLTGFEDETGLLATVSHCSPRSRGLVPREYVLYFSNKFRRLEGSSGC